MISDACLWANVVAKAELLGREPSSPRVTRSSFLAVNRIPRGGPSPSGWSRSAHTGRCTWGVRQRRRAAVIPSGDIPENWGTCDCAGGVVGLANDLIRGDRPWSLDESS
jgi:hypothetical protein